jgi:hypothetical protein
MAPFAVYRGLRKGLWFRQWRLLHIRPLVNRLLRRYDSVNVQFTKIGKGDLRGGHSEFPHPLVSLDYNKDGDLVEVSVLRPRRGLRGGLIIWRS